MLLASKHLNMVTGVDVHMVTIPPSPAPVPIPHPYIGIIMDPLDYIPVVGTQVHVNKQKRANAGTISTLGTMAHIPLGAGFHPSTAPMIAHEGIHFFGSMTVKTDGSYTSVSTFNMMTCSCIGMPLGGAEKYLPTSVSLPMAGGMPVFVGGPQVPDVAGVLMSLLSQCGLKFLLKKAGKLFKKLKKKKRLGCNC
ncbi:hypothetical protein [Aureivirga marina]|uniref:hypothetical protein n=1 Tax=Aureivirga marina TaxID=1182451 RepID=UPI0018C96709|nr:hypothetical protein [Aureivirga marina]